MKIHFFFIVNYAILVLVYGGKTMDKELFDFDSMSNEELSNVGNSKFKPTSKTKEEEMPKREAFGLPDEEELHMPKRESFGLTEEEKKPEMEKPKLKESTPVKKEETEKEEKKSKEGTLSEFGNKLDELLREDSILRNRFDSLDNDGKKKNVSRLKEIAKEYDELVKAINEKISGMTGSDIDPETMTQEEILSELRKLRVANNRLRNEYDSNKNDEVKVAIEDGIIKLNNRYSVLVSTYNNIKTL